MKQLDSSDKKDDCNAEVMYFDGMRVLTKSGGCRGGSSSSSVCSPYIVRIEKMENIANFVSGIKMEPVVPFECISLENVYDTKVEEKTQIVTGFDLLYRIGICKLPGSSHDFFTAIDKFGVMNFGMNEAVLRNIINKDLQQEPKFESWKDMIRGDVFREVVQSIDSIALLRSMKEKGILFRDVVDYVIDDTTEKEFILVFIAKACRLPIKFSLRERLQPFNANAVIFGNSGTGKSLAFQRLLGREAPQTVSVPGMFGGFTKSGGINPGSLSGVGVEVIDEIGRKVRDEDRDEIPILEKTLTYTETGESVRNLVSPVICRGTKSICVIGNADLDDKEMKGLERFLVRKCSEHANNRMGRRYPILIYRNDMNQVHKHDFDAIMVGKCRILVDAILVQNTDVIANNLIKGLRWCSFPDKKFEAYFMDLSRRFSSSVLREYVMGISVAYSRVKFAALKVAVFDNLDRLILTKKKKDIVFGEVMKEAKMNYAFLVSEIQRSFSGIKESPYDMMVTLIDNQVSVLDIVKQTGLSTATVYRYIEKIGKGTYGKKKKSEDDKVGF